jgi:cytochrome P450
MNVDHISNKNFGNYGKGSNFKEIFDFFGDGMINSDSDDWKQKRTMHHLILKGKSFKKMFHQTIQKKVENCLLPFLKNVCEESVLVDLQDVFNRFTFDTNCTILLGFDPNTLPNKFSELREIAYQKSLPIIEEVIFYRHFIPTCLWKLQKWFHIGQEKKLNIAQQNLNRFLYESITFSKQEQSKSEKTDECYFDLVKVLEKEGYGKGKIGEKFLRDIILNLLVAGNGTISSGLSWFFWLVSIHPIVEAKIIQEMKDNCITQTQNENWSISRLEDNLDKLVYLHGAICEALRLYPPVPFEHMCAIKSNILPSGDHVSENTKVMYHLYAMGRIEQIWGKDCMEFKPERWISETGHVINVPSYKFIAFNTGPRSCMGKDISFFEMKMVAASILWNFHIQVVEGHHVTPLLSIILRMKHGLKVKLTKRCI